MDPFAISRWRLDMRAQNYLILRIRDPLLHLWLLQCLEAKLALFTLSSARHTVFAEWSNRRWSLRILALIASSLKDGLQAWWAFGLKQIFFDCWDIFWRGEDFGARPCFELAQKLIFSWEKLFWANYGGGVILGNWFADITADLDLLIAPYDCWIASSNELLLVWVA